MGLFDNTSDLLPGLLPTAWRGLKFWSVNAEHTVGRRIHTQLFPGIALKTHDDTGPLDGPIRISGFVIGDDYIAQARALEEAFRTPGPGTLIHPWRGPIRCILLRPATFEYDVQDLRVCRIEAEFDPVTTGLSGLQTGSTLVAALISLSRAVNAATSLASHVLSASPMALALYSRGVTATALSLDIAQGWASQSARSASLIPVLVASRTTFASATAESVRSKAAPLLAAIPANLAAGMSAVFKVQPPSGLGRGELAPKLVPVDPAAGAQLMLAVAADMGRRLRPQEILAIEGLPSLPVGATTTALTERAVMAAMEVGSACQAAALVTSIAFTSRQDAQGWAHRVDDALRRASVTAELLANEATAPAASLWRSLGDARALLARDLSEALGRLPNVEMVTPPGRCGAILLAQHLVGDDPRRVMAFAADIAIRNRLRHPAVLGAGPIEVLR